MVDIGSLIFVEFFKMTAFPGSPFSGNIINDLIMFIFIPSAILLSFLYVITMKMPLAKEHRGFRMMITIVLYLFIVLNGYYATIAYTSAFYIILLLLVGVIWFIGDHGRNEARGGGMPSRGYGRGMSARDERAIRKSLSGKMRDILAAGHVWTNKDITHVRRELSDVEKRIEKLDEEIIESRGRTDNDRNTAELNRQKGELENKAGVLRRSLDEAEGRL